MPASLFQPLKLGQIELANRIVVAPMCQYSAEADGSMNDWHLMHLGMLSSSGAGLLFVEATAVEPQGRISAADVGLYDDKTEAAMARVIAACRRWGQAKLGIQLGHAGRKASAEQPWKGGKSIHADKGGWGIAAPSPLPFGAGWQTPQELSLADIARIQSAFVEATQRAARLGFDVLELHSAHGYLLHQFLSPLSNRRTDDYGGSLANRMRFPLETLAAVRAVWPKERPLGARVSATDWIEGGWDLEQTLVLADAMKRVGCDFIDVSSGGTDAAAKVPIGPGYQVPFAREVKARVGLPTMAVGMITEPEQADAIVARGDADLIALARGFLDDPHWGWHAAARLGASFPYPVQYERATWKLWPPAKRYLAALPKAAE
jgi:2,4-dienoyl-CoA reductase-like NADH-dependent reductase (Old Yellow Enzyme family)